MKTTSSLSWKLSIKEVLVTFIPLIIGIYGNFYLKAKFLDNRKYLLYAIAFILLVILCATLFEIIRYYELQIGNSFGQNIINLLFVFPTSLGLQYLKRGLVSQYQIQELKAKTVENELNALKAQLNPHFLFNTLNNIYGVNQIDSNIGSEMLLELSQLMRYHLESSKSNRVSLDSELDLLGSYIKLEKLRLPSMHETIFKTDNFPRNIKIPPLILLPFVENAYKHGTHSTKESYVHILCQWIENSLHFNVKNSVFRSKNTIKTNIGLENTKRRIDLIYGGSAKLDIHDDRNEFNVHLVINLDL